MRRALALALLLVLPAAAGAGARQVAFVERSSVHALEGALAEGGAQAFRFPVQVDNVTRVAFRLRWDPAASAAFSLAVLDPHGHAVAPPAIGAAGALDVEAGDVAPVPPALALAAASGEGAFEEALAAAVSRAGRGEWRIAVRAEEGPADPVPFALEVAVTRYEALALNVITLEAGAADAARAWAAAAWVLALAVLALGARLARSRPVARPVVPPGDKTPSPGEEQGRCASEG